MVFIKSFKINVENIKWLKYVLAFDELRLHKIHLFVTAGACRSCDTWNADCKTKTYTLLQRTRSGVGSELQYVILVQKINVSSLKILRHIIKWLCQLKEPSRKIEEDSLSSCEKKVLFKNMKGRFVRFNTEVTHACSLFWFVHFTTTTISKRKEDVFKNTHCCLGSVLRLTSSSPDHSH